ncbi:MAG: TatD family hydrolase [Thermoplasmata archaeon]|nr:TatD family hydrolase [Thermoplasmata archaeon]
MPYPVFDNHVHLQENGENVLAAKRFEKEGGRIINLCNIPGIYKPVDLKYFMDQYERIVRIADLVRKETSLNVLVTVGPYPVDLIKSSEIIGLENAKELFLDAIELAITYVQDGKANAVGEIGRPHFQVDENIWIVSNEILSYALKRAGKEKIPVVLHTESADEKVFNELSIMAEKSGIDKNFVIKHFSPPLILEEENHGIFPSVISSRDNIREAINKGFRFFMETDFLDDPMKKGAVMDITTVPKRFKMLENENKELLEKYSYELKENLFKIYRLELKDF